MSEPPQAVLVTYSLIRTRVHWPTDVAAGAALGSFTASPTQAIRNGPEIGC